MVDAYPILKETWVNLRGRRDPWGTWLSCEEIETGKVFECDPKAGNRSTAATGSNARRSACSNMRPAASIRPASRFT